MSCKFSSSLLSRNVNCLTWKHSISELAHFSWGRILCCKSRFKKNNWKKINKTKYYFYSLFVQQFHQADVHTDQVYYFIWSQRCNINAVMVMSGNIIDGFILCSALFSCFGIPSQWDPGLAVLRWQSFLTPSAWLFCYLHGVLTCGLAATKSCTQEKRRNAPNPTSHKTTNLRLLCDHQGHTYRGKGSSPVSHRHTLTLTEPFASPPTAKHQKTGDESQSEYTQITQFVS